MAKLVEGVHRFRADYFNRNRELFRTLAQRGQRPETLFITCSDARIDPNRITDSSPGDLFIVRNVGNIVPQLALPGGTSAALEYAVEVLQVSNIVVCGHTHCGAMEALLDPSRVQGLVYVQRWLSQALRLRENRGRTIRAPRGHGAVDGSGARECPRAAGEPARIPVRGATARGRDAAPQRLGLCDRDRRGELLQSGGRPVRHDRADGDALTLCSPHDEPLHRTAPAVPSHDRPELLPNASSRRTRRSGRRTSSSPTGSSSGRASSGSSARTTRGRGRRRAATTGSASPRARSCRAASWPA